MFYWKALPGWNPGTMNSGLRHKNTIAVLL